MDRILILLLYIFCQIIMFSDQNAVTEVLSVPKGDLEENDPVTLKCKAQGQHTLFEWILNDNVIVKTNANGTTTITQGRDPDVYVVELVNKTETKQVFKLIISRVSRVDSGRWTCRVTAPSGTYTGNHVVDVNYIPDPRYPECELSDQGYATCTTQIGHPKVDIQWMDIDGSVIRGFPSNTNTTMISVKANVFNVQTPETVQDSLTCQMIRPDRNCSILTEDIYDIFYITLTGNDDNSFICTVNPSEFMEYLIWVSDAELLGTKSSYGQNGTKITFGNIDFKWNGTGIKCVLKWGAFNTTYKTSYVAIDSQTTTHATKLTDTTVPKRNPMNTEGEDIQNRDHLNRSPNNYPYETSPPKGGSTTSHGGPPPSIPIGSTMFTASDENSTSEESPINNENVSNDGSGSGTLRIVIIAVVIAVIICLLIIVLCVCYNRKHAPKDAVI